MIGQEASQGPGGAPAIDPIIHAPIRLQIMAALAVLTEKSPGYDFGELRRLTAATDGNLGAHLATLEKAGYASIEKAFVNKRPRTTVSITPQGRAAYSAHVAALKAIIGSGV
jgi:DNA-binding MarR family transcriptional regulator